MEEEEGVGQRSLSTSISTMSCATSINDDSLMSIDLGSFPVINYEGPKNENGKPLPLIAVGPVLGL